MDLDNSEMRRKRKGLSIEEEESYSTTRRRIDTDKIELGINLSVDYENIIAKRSWFNLFKKKEKDDNLSKAYSQIMNTLLKLEICSITEREEQLEKTCRLIKLFPSAEQRVILRKWFGAHRWIYNKCISLKDSINTKQELREHIINRRSPCEEQFPWIKEIPYDIKEGAILAYLNALESNFAKRKLNPNHTFTMRFKSKKSASQAIYLRHRVWKENKIYPRFGMGKLHTAEKLDLSHDTHIVFKRGIKTYYVPKLDVVKCENQALNQHIAALDPGVRTFQTIVGTDGSCILAGHESRKLILKYLIRIDEINKKLGTIKSRKFRKNLQLKKAKLHHRIKSLVNTLHYEIIKQLKHFKYILIPSFETKNMSRGNSRSIGKETTRLMGQLSHYRFKERLLHKARLYGQKVIIADESYTSKTCSNCKESSDPNGPLFNCSYCGFKWNRDLNAAKNIMDKNIHLIVNGCLHH